MPRTVPPADATKRQLREWATTAGLPVDAQGYFLNPADNFFEPLSACTHAELSQGDGNEIGGDGARGKIQALHSSSAERSWSRHILHRRHRPSLRLYN